MLDNFFPNKISSKLSPPSFSLFKPILLGEYNKDILFPLKYNKSWLTWLISCNEFSIATEILDGIMIYSSVIEDEIDGINE